MMETTRTGYVIKNSIYSIIAQGVNIIIKFVLRMVFINLLGEEYLGVNSVFTNVLTMLSLAELGIGSAIIYDLYKPIANKDTEEIVGYIKIFKKVYAFIGFIVLFFGLALIPFLNNIITNVPNIDNIILIYLLFLIDSVLSYFFAHYQSLISAYQMNYINTTNTVYFNILKTIAQLIVLLLYKNFILYLIMQIVFNLLGNYVLSRKAKKMFPFINNRDYNKIDNNKIKGIFKNSMSLFSLKVSAMVVNSTDNIVISSLLSTVLAGIYSNYSLIISTVQQTIYLFVNSLQASLGNLCAIETKEKCKEVFHNLFFSYSFIYCLSSLAFIAVLSDVIVILFGKQYILSEILVLIITLNFYMAGVRQSVVGFYTANGLFKFFKIMPWIEVILNIGVSIGLVNIIGIEGVFLGTLISHLLTKFWFEPYILYKYAFQTNLRDYYVKYIKYFMVFVFGVILLMLINKFFISSSLFITVLKLIVAILYTIIIYCLFFKDKQEYQYMRNMVISIIKKFLNIIKRGKANG